MHALQSGLLAMYPEYLNVFNSAVASDKHGFHSRGSAYRAAQRYALAHGLQLLSPTPFSDTGAIAVTVGYAQANHLRSLEDLPRLGNTLTLGGPPENEQTSPTLAHVERTYDFTPRGFRPLAVGAQYSALNDGSVQAAEVQSTDGQLASGDYRLLDDPLNVFAWGNVVPVVSARALNAEGPAFAATIDKVSALLTTRTIRELNQAVDVSGQEPADGRPPVSGDPRADPAVPVISGYLTRGSAKTAARAKAARAALAVGQLLHLQQRRRLH